MSPSDSVDAPPALRADYQHWRTIGTRWKDNDVYGHVNNVEYYSFFDTVINAFLVEAGLDIHTGAQIGLCVESSCRFMAPLAFPQNVDAGLRVLHLGRSSVRYGIGLFAAGSDEPAAQGSFVHVFVDRLIRRPVPVPDPLRAALATLMPGSPRRSTAAQEV